jgi:predicted DNA-binding antitoxin AbrB/MazE fold protein
MASIELRDGLPPAGFGQYNQQCEGEAMTTAVKAVYEDGVFEPKEPVELEHAEVEVLIPTQPKRDPDDPTGWKAIDRLIGSLKSGTSDVSEKHDE